MSVYSEISQALDEVFTDIAPSQVDVYNSSGTVVASDVQVFVAKKPREKINVSPHVKFIFRADELIRVGLWSSGKNTILDSYYLVYESLTYRVSVVQDFGKVEGSYVATIVQTFEDFFVTLSIYRMVAATPWTVGTLTLNRTLLGGLVEIDREDSLLYSQRGIEVHAEMYCYWSTVLTADEVVKNSTDYWNVVGIENVSSLNRYKRVLLVRRRA